MIKTLTHLKPFLVIVIFLNANAQGQQKVMWKGSIYVENGVKIVKNPNEPLYNELRLELQEELSIGKKNAEEHSFNLISDVKTDNRGNIYIADTKNLRILKFDRSGMYVKTLGKGVVEFQQPSKIYIDKLSERIFVRASAQDIEIFNNRDQYKSGIHLKNEPIIDFAPIDDGHVMAVLGLEYRGNDPRVMRSLFQLNSNGEMKSLSEEYFRYALENIGVGWMANNTGFEPELYLSKIDESSYVYGYSKKYELNVINKEGKVLYRIVRSGPRPIFTSEERKLFKVNISRDVKPYFFQLLTDSKGRIYVQRNKTKGILNTVQESINKEIDIFSKDGYFLYTSRLPCNTCEIRDGFLYAYAVDEVNGLESVKRYKIRNWEEIEAGI